jgi:hypothetical protein
MIADIHRKDGGIRANGHMIAYMGWFPFCLIACGAAFREQVIDEHYPMPDKTVVPDLDKLTDESVRLDLTGPADPHIFLDLCKRPDKAVAADRTTIKIDRLHNGYIARKNNVICNTGVFDVNAH